MTNEELDLEAVEARIQKAARCIDAHHDTHSARKTDVRAYLKDAPALISEIHRLREVQATNWEYGAQVVSADGYQLMREPEYVGSEDGVRHWLDYPPSALSRHANDDTDHVELKRRHPASEWQPIPEEQETR